MKRTPKFQPSPNSAAGVAARMRQEKLRAKPMKPEGQTNTLLAYHQGLIAMTEGRATAYHLDTVIYAMNVGAILCAQVFGNEHLSLFVEGIEGLQRAIIRFKSSGKVGLDGTALTACKAAYDIHAAQVETATLGELQDAINTMRAKTGLPPLVFG